MAKRNTNRPQDSEVNQSRGTALDQQSATRQSEDPSLDATVSGDEEISDVNQLNAFGGDQPARNESAVAGQTESHGENLGASDARANESVEAVAESDSSQTDDSKYNS